MRNQLSALEIYMNRVFKAFIVGLPFAACLAGITFTILKVLGYYPSVSLIALIIFDVTNVIYIVLGIIIRVKCEDNNRLLKPRIVFIGKILIIVVEVIQWNFIAYMIPSIDTWAFSFFFVVLTSFLLDSKFTLICALVIVGSTFVSWQINGANLLPPTTDPYYIPNLVLRYIATICGNGVVVGLTFVIERVFVAELERIADMDSLTRLNNRRTLRAKLDESIIDFKKNDKPLAVLMCDIDDFKQINDTLGHDFGDIVLKNIASEFLETVKDQGIVFRYGGEEILCILYKEPNEAKEIAELLRENISKIVTTFYEKSAQVTVTIGVACFNRKMSPGDLIKKADMNMYYGKKHGKNRVILQ